MRAIVIRAVIDLARSQRGQEHEIGLSPEGLASLPSPELDPELAHLKGTYRGEFERAFEAAVSALEPSERNALRQHLIHGLNIDQIGALYGIHRSTAARRIASARQHLLDETHARLRERLRVTAGELDSIMRLIDSQLDVSVARLLASQK
jgi:RNA polymerase sigma-70 factor (ECF subfamily)